MNPEDLGCKAIVCIYLPVPLRIMAGLVFLLSSGSVFAAFETYERRKNRCKKKNCLQDNK
jgi:hypothetical protein